jgi:primosomal protein N' (replication factor Y) (superfamily II helicase)
VALFGEEEAGPVVRVLPDQTGLTKTFHYTVPERWADRVHVGTRVRVALGPRRIGAWVVEVDAEAPAGVDLRPIAKVTGEGPPPDLVELASWARWRWAARTPVPFLRTATPERAVTALPDPRPRRHPVPPSSDGTIQGAFAGGAATLRLPPVADLVPVVQAAVSLGDALFLCTSREQVRRISDRLMRAGVPTAVHPGDWAVAAAGGASVVGTRAAAWAPVPDLAAVVVFDEHDEVHQEERSPTWNARDVALERARRRGVPCVLTSPMPTLEALASTRPVAVPRVEERAGWPRAVVIDRREEDRGRNALFSPQLADVVRSGARVVCVLNQKGRAALLACAGCGDVARCERCGAAVRRPDSGALVCRRCQHERPVVCATCGRTHLKTLRMGVGRVRDDLEALAGERVVAVTGDGSGVDVADVTGARLHVGTEAVLHRVPTADVVAFLDLDQELFAPRYRAAEQALALLVRAARIVGGRQDEGRLMLQTRSPDHEVVRAALEGAPDLVSSAERSRRELLDLPPFSALAEIGDAAAASFADSLRHSAPPEVSVLGPHDGSWQVRAPDHRVLCDALAAVERPPGRLRLSVDPPRV